MLERSAEGYPIGIDYNSDNICVFYHVLEQLLHGNLYINANKIVRSLYLHTVFVCLYLLF